MLAITAAVACDPVEPEVTPSLDVDKTAVSVAAEAGEATFTVTSNNDWTASADADWVKVNPNNGKASDKAVAVVVTAEDNTAETERTAIVTVKAGELSKTVTVTQAAKTVTPEPEYAIDGKQWFLDMGEMKVLVDIGLYDEEAMVVALPLSEGTGFGAYMYGMYEVEKSDALSGKVIFTQYDPEWDEFMDSIEFPYSGLSESEVYISAEPLLGDPTPLPFAAVAEPYEIRFEGGSQDGPSGPIADGAYWLFNGTKVMAPLAEGATSGRLPAEASSTERNAFTLTYDADRSYYTIQDAYGRYIGQTDESGNITVTDVLPKGDSYAFYLWCVEPGYGEACSIYNSIYYYDITYSAADDSWVLLMDGYKNPEILPILVPAE